MKSTCLIVGGGVIGLSVAWELAQHGLQCVLLDAGPIGRGSSWAGAGVLPPANFATALDPIDRLRGLSHQLHPEWAERLREQTGLDPEFRRCGGIYLARKAGEAAALVGQAQYWREYEIEAKPLSWEELARWEPALGAGLRNQPPKGAWWTPEEYHMRPPSHLRALTAACRLSGVELREHTPVKGLRIRDQQVEGVELEHDTLFADQVVLCCGAWASRFADPRGAIPDVYPVRGQAVLYQSEPGLLTRIINEGNRYLVPRIDGKIYVGSNEEEVGWVEGTTERVIEELCGWAESLLPMLQRANIEATWSGLRPGSFDGFAYLGGDPRCKNLYFATGHYRSGLHLSTGTALLLRQLITGQQTSIPLDTFNVARSTVNRL